MRVWASQMFVVVFALTIRTLGLAFAGPLAMIIGSFASEEMRWKETIIFAAGMTAFLEYVYDNHNACATSDALCTCRGMFVMYWPRCEDGSPLEQQRFNIAGAQCEKCPFSSVPASTSNSISASQATY